MDSSRDDDINSVAKTNSLRVSSKGSTISAEKNVKKIPDVHVCAHLGWMDAGAFLMQKPESQGSIEQKQSDNRQLLNLCLQHLKSSLPCQRA